MKYMYIYLVTVKYGDDKIFEYCNIVYRLNRWVSVKCTRHITRKEVEKISIR